MKGLMLMGMVVLAATTWAGQGAKAMERAIEKSVMVKASPSEVWNSWTSSQGVREFLGVDSYIELKFGGRYEILFDNKPPVGLQGSEGCQILSYVPERMLSFTWNAPPSLPEMRNQKTFVVIQLTQGKDGTQVDLRQGGIGKGAGWDKYYDYFNKAWDSVLHALKERYEQGPVKAETSGSRNETPSVVALEQIRKMVGGTWKAEVKDESGKPMEVQFTYKLHPDGKGVIGEGRIGDSTHVYTQFGWDRLAKAVYYLDTHDSETVYFGHVFPENDDLIFTFSPIGMLPQVFGSRSRFLDGDTLQSIIRDADGHEVVGLTLKRTR
jgi:uncharacterized protein YndB with AHSA1/START domain